MGRNSLKWLPSGEETLWTWLPTREEIHSTCLPSRGGTLWTWLLTGEETLLCECFLHWHYVWIKFVEYVVILFLISYASCCASNAFCCSSNFSPSTNIALIKLPHICYNFFLLNEFKASLTILTLNYNTCTIMVMVFIKTNKWNKNQDLKRF